PKELDVEQDIWPACQPNAVFISNFVHFVNWKKIHSMLAGVQRLLPQEGLLIIYGPFNYDGQYTSEGNLTLDEWLRSRDPDSGIKDFEQLMLIARQYGLFLTADEDMPANNRTLVFTKLDVA
ncbi:MAG: DUF938 domain-containing protein, partial [Oleibacter sp.]|nr:DUF938 domain-containing protein [Thalassolituus sp.]